MYKTEIITFNNTFLIGLLKQLKKHTQKSLVPKKNKLSTNISYHVYQEVEIINCF